MVTVGGNCNGNVQCCDVKQNVSPRCEIGVFRETVLTRSRATSTSSTSAFLFRFKRTVTEQLNATAWIEEGSREHEEGAWQLTEIELRHSLY